MLVKYFKLAAIILPFVLTVLLPTGLPAALANGPDIVSIEILTVNDFHGAIAKFDRNPGAARLAGFLKSETSYNQAGTMILSAGDMFQGTPDSNLLYGKNVIRIMNAAGFSAMALGNHEFDWGLPVLKARMAEATFPILAANILDKKTGQPVDFVKPYIILEKAGVKIAVVGIITQDTAVTTNPKNIEGYFFADPATVLNKLVPQIRAEGADIVVVLAHLASYQENGEITGDAANLASTVPGIDAVVSGHSHQKVAGKVNGIMVVQAGYSGRQVAEIHLAYSKRLHQVLGSTGNIVEIAHVRTPVDLAVQKITAESLAELEPVKKIVLGSAATDLDHDRYQLSPLGRWVADAMREAAKTDIAFENGGGIRTGLKAGVITAGNLYEVMPFDNNLYRAELTGAQIRAALEIGIDNKTFGTLQFSGIKVKYDPSAPQGKRVVSVTMLDGRELSDGKVYTVATNDFLLSGGDGFYMLKEARNITDTYQTLRDVLSEAIKKAGKIGGQADDRLNVIGGGQTGVIKPAA